MWYYLIGIWYEIFRPGGQGVEELDLLIGDSRECLKPFASSTFDCCITSPPFYGLRDYGVEGQLGLEKTPEEYVAELVAVFREVRRVLKDDGTLWLNIGDSYNAGRNGGHPGGGSQWKPEQGKYQNRSGANVNGLKPKDLIGIPWMVAFALRADGWYLRSEIIWAKGNPMPESVTDRPTRAHEQIFLLSKSPKYYYDVDAIREPWADKRNGNPGFATSKYEEIGQSRYSGRDSTAPKTPGRNRRSVWNINTKPFKGAHFAVFPEALVLPCVLAGSRPMGKVLDPFMGSGTVGVVAKKTGRDFVGVDLNPDYVKIARGRIGVPE